MTDNLVKEIYSSVIDERNKYKKELDNLRKAIYNIQQYHETSKNWDKVVRLMKDYKP